MSTPVPTLRGPVDKDGNLISTKGGRMNLVSSNSGKHMGHIPAGTAAAIADRMSKGGNVQLVGANSGKVLGLLQHAAGGNKEDLKQAIQQGAGLRGSAAGRGNGGGRRNLPPEAKQKIAEALASRNAGKGGRGSVAGILNGQGKGPVAGKTNGEKRQNFAAALKNLKDNPTPENQAQLAKLKEHFANRKRK